MKKTINLHKNPLGCSRPELKNYEIMILNIGVGSSPKLKSQGIRALAM